MSKRARQLNGIYLNEMRDADAGSVLGRVRDFYWDAYLSIADEKGLEYALDNLDLAMDEGRERLAATAVEHARDQGFSPGDAQYVQRVSQVMKSNTGKGFERLAGLALAHALHETDADYCVQPSRIEDLGRLGIDKGKDLAVTTALGEGDLLTHIDADTVAANPTDPDAEIFMMSMKSTLKDRFHNVPFWNLLRRVAASGSSEFDDIQALSPDRLGKMRYVGICSDLAEEQPDFRAEAGPRNMLKVDAALLDAAYVSASRAIGLPGDCHKHLGVKREHAFYWYSCFFRHLTRS